MDIPDHELGGEKEQVNLQTEACVKATLGNKIEQI